MKNKLFVRIDKLDSLSHRDRLSLALGLLAVAVGMEMMWVEPMQAKRQRIEQSAVADTASRQEAKAAADSERRLQLQDLRARGEQLQASLAAMGMADAIKPERQAEALSSFLARSLQQKGVVLVATHALAVEVVNAPATNDGAAAAVASESAASSPDVKTGPQLFRHRTELTLEGSVAHLIAAIDLLERGMAPLQIERVKLASRNADKSAAAGSSTAVQATVVLTVINQERTWVAL
jgi:hypothetical protein